MHVAMQMKSPMRMVDIVTEIHVLSSSSVGEDGGGLDVRPQHPEHREGFSHPYLSSNVCAAEHE